MGYSVEQWRVFFTGVAALAAVAGAVWAVIQIWGKLHPPERLQAIASVSDYRRDPFVRQFFDNLHQQLNIPEEHIPELPESPSPQAIKERMAAMDSRAQVNRLLFGIKQQIIESEFESELRAVWVIKITNTGSKTLKGVLLKVPDLAVSTLDGTVLSKQNGKDANAIAIGVMSPGDERNAVVWCASRPYLMEQNPVTLVHDDGRGRVAWHKLAPPPRFKLNNQFTVFFCLFLMWFLLLYAARIRP